ncbi:uncharacterized protein MAM_07974 [Metarhizium album ARSEF 1941]|uniref:Uncharacterized protein n=1 Tax=Metarhizium album (strain ARSEF 1941) TaxID=1081103 RepID=A0A0B2WKD7_METAS|nr:uncharacterized protein MAM_07974 [Metarhizium album ARSEF 1941]KHN94134.1 hypothetical protein MAM_07974 [Metarhizium album ARSEF 1941]
MQLVSLLELACPFNHRARLVLEVAPLRIFGVCYGATGVAATDFDGFLSATATGDCGSTPVWYTVSV